MNLCLCHCYNCFFRCLNNFLYGIFNKKIANKINRTESPRRFGHFLVSSKSHDEVDIEKKGSGKKGKLVDSPLRRSILEANETADDSSAAEDIGDERHASKIVRPMLRPVYPPTADLGEIQVLEILIQLILKIYLLSLTFIKLIKIAINFDSNRNKLVVRIIQAHGLINTDKDNLSDPYARVVILPDKKKKSKRKTRVIKDTLQPMWEETFEYDVASLSDARTKTLDVVVKNDKSLFSREKTFMGECLISLEAMFDLEFGNVDWYKLQDHGVFESIIKKIQD